MASKILLAVAVVGLGGCRAERAPEAPAVAPVESAARNGSQPERAAPAAMTRSQFTSLEPKSCRTIEQNLEEGPYSRDVCAGVAGYKLEVSESDLRQDIDVIAPGGVKSELGLSAIVAKGAFNSLGKLAEWRGADPARPQALIVRLNVAGGPNGDEPDVSRLVVVRLKTPACIVAVVPPAAGQNEQARQVADGKLPDCLPRQ
jgi:hypothetical protein